MTDAQGANSELSAKRNQWLEWARKQIGGDEARIQAAAEAALRAALGGASSQEAAAAGSAAVGLGGGGPVTGRPASAPPATSAPGTPPVPAGHDNAPTRRAWYRRPTVLLAMAVVILVLAGLLIWGISSRMSGPGAPTTSVVPSSSTTKQTTKRTKKSTTSPTGSASPNAVTGTVIVTIPSTSP
jgi:hypothetical protein